MFTTIFIITTLFSGLMAGLFYAWSISVTPGIAKINNQNYLKAFQSMNRAIINPLFIICFMSLPLLLPIHSYLSYGTEQFYFVLMASTIYLLGVFSVTIFGNIPLNNKLEKLHIESMTHDQMESFRFSFEQRWNNFNLIRTISSSLSFLFLILAHF